MLSVSTVFLFVAVGLVSGQATTILPSPSPSYVANSSSSSAPTSSSSSMHNMTSSSSSPLPMSSSISPNGTSSSHSPSSTSPTSKPTSKPTPKPTSKPPKTFGDYSVKNKNGSYCLLSKLDAYFMIPYEVEKGPNKTDKMMANVHMPFNEAMFDTNGSMCGPSSPKLQINWPRSHPLYQFTMTFASLKKGASNATEWEVTNLTLMAITTNNPDFRPNATAKSITVGIKNTTELSGLTAGMKGYYMCAINHTYAFTSGQLLLKYVKLQPFGVNETKNEQFGKEYNCELSPNPTPAPKSDNNIVPIAVGCALAGLVLIVLIAYIIGRRKSQRGYEKV